MGKNKENKKIQDTKSKSKRSKSRKSDKESNFGFGFDDGSEFEFDIKSKFSRAKSTFQGLRSPKESHPPLRSGIHAPAKEARKDSGVSTLTQNLQLIEEAKKPQEKPRSKSRP